MKNKSPMFNASFWFLFLFMSISAFCQSEEFEGIITYEVKELNPNPLLISDEDFYNSMPENSVKLMKMYVKKNKYKMVYEDREEEYIPSKGQIAISSKHNSDTTYFISESTLEDPVLSTKDMENKDVVYNKECSIVEIKNKWQTRYFYYNTELLTTNKNYWKRHYKDFLASFIAKSNTFPLQIITKSMLGNYSMKVVKIETVPLNENLTIPVEEKEKK